jgi:hypothetical protein
MKYIYNVFASVLMLSIGFSNTQWVSINENGDKIDKVRVENSDIYSTTLTFSIDGFSNNIVDGEDGTIIRHPNSAQILEQGAPDLPQFSASIIIPDDKSMEYRIINSTYIDYPNYDILPSKGNLSRLINPETIPYEYGIVYSENKFYPNQIAELREPYILRDVRGLAVVTYPIQFNPITHTLRVYSEITIEVYSNGRGLVNVLNRNLLPENRPMEFENIYNSHFENTNNDLRFDYLVDHGNMLIISNEAFMSTMNPLIEWKNLKGIPVEMVSLTEAGGNSTNIKQFVADYYHNNGLTFLLLVGDVAQLPSPSISGALSDPSYGFIDGNDSYAEVIVGRFSGSTPSQIETQVTRSIEYERVPNDGNWYTKSVGIASNQGPGWGGLTDDVFNEDALCPLLLDYNYDDCPVIADPTGTLAQGVNAINEGRSIINYTGHGYQLGWGNGAPLGLNEVHGLTNSGMLPFVITVGCNVGEFDAYDESFAEAWLRATHNGNPSGGIAHMGSTISQSWEPPMHGQYGMNLILTESLDEHKTRTIGGIATNGCMYMNDMQGGSGINETNYWTYFGDPSVNIRTLPPTDLSATYDGTILIGQSNFSVSTGNEGDLVALSRNGELLISGYTNTSGNINLDISNATSIPGDLDLVISSYNKYSFETTVSVISPEGAFLVYNNYQLTTDPNDNGLVDFGEEVSISLLLENVGVENSETVSGTIGTSDEYVSMYGNDISFASISSGQTGVSESSFTFNTAINTPNSHLISFQYNLSNGSDNWEGEFSVVVNAPVFEVTNAIIFDENGDGIWEAGEYANIEVHYGNSGNIGFWNYPGLSISTTSDYVTVEYSSETFYGIDANQSGSYQFYAVASEDTPLGTVAQFNVVFGPSITNGCFGTPENCPILGELSFNSTIGLEFNEALNEPLNLTANANDFSILVSWDEPTSCPEGQFSDCAGLCQDNSYLDSWLGDGLCDDGSWGVYFNCEAFNCDEGDCTGCDGGGEDPYCGDGNCDNNEDYTSCPDDCDAPITDSCEGNCGGNSGNCWCDDQCESLGDCCPDFYDFCAGDSTIAYGKLYEYTHSSEGERKNMDLNVNTSSREFLGYNLYRDGLFITYTTESQYEDSNIVGGVEYCYDVLAVYDDGISNLSNSDCALLEAELLMGDLNMDGNVNVTDIILEINIIIGALENPTDYQWIVGDINSDGAMNVLDIVGIVNIILNGGLQLNDSIPSGKAQIINDKLILTVDSGVAGFQFAYKGEIQAIEIDSNWEIKYQNGIAIGYTFDRNLKTILELNILNIELEGLILLSDASGNGIEVNISNMPKTFGLNSAYPNPFNPVTTISYDIADASFININVYDLLGNQVASLVNEMKNSGEHSIQWNADGLSSGLYFVKMEANNEIFIDKLMLMK